MEKFGALSRADPKTIWSHEAHHFTPWLAQNLDVLGGTLGMDLELVDVEKDVGDFSADILARDLGRDRLVVIENQLALTDHGHLGQVITYAAGVEAGAVVWVSPEIRDQHGAALDWLNRGFDGKTEFFAVQLEILSIDGSRPAVNLRPVATPHRWSRRKKVGSGSGERSPRQEAYLQFFQRLIDELRTKHNFTNARRGQPQNWYSFSAGRSGFSYGISFALGGRVRAELYIDTGDEGLNAECFQSLQLVEDRVQEEFDSPLTWEPLDERQACRITCYRDGSIDDSQEQIDEYHEWAIDHLLRFKRAFGDRIGSLARTKK